MSSSRLVLDGGLKHGALIDFLANIKTDCQHQDADKEWPTPTVAGNALLRQQSKDQGRGEQTYDVAELNEGTVEATLLRGRIFDQHGGSTAPFTAQGKSLEQAQDDDD